MTPSIQSSWTRAATRALSVTVALASWAVATGGCSTPVTNETNNTFIAPICDGGTMLCDEGCVDISTDRDNCGACGLGCAGTCSQGICSLTCLGGFIVCDDACVDVQNDPANCGECGNACGAGKVCSLGKCEVECPIGSLLCGNACANLATNANNCGGCGKVCAGAPNADGTCAASVCGIACDEGFATCDGNEVNGCETDTAGDPLNCGGCGKVCEGVANGTPTCAASKCGIACGADYSDCSGACVNQETDAKNCGGCGNVCAVGESCKSGGCANNISACDQGSDPKDASVTYVVCSADASSAWISGKLQGLYHAEAICKALGYVGLGQYGGNCGNVCGYCEDETTSCSQPGNKTFDMNGNKGTDDLGIILGYFVTWECVNT